MMNSTIPRASARLMLFLAISLLVSGCATLDVTPVKQVTAASTKQPVTLGIQVAGERLREALNDPQESAATAASGKLFDKVLLLPKDSRYATPAETQAAFATDYILTGTLSDISVGGNLNPYWFAAIPMLFFKPYAPIVTFEATVNIETSVIEAKTGATLFKKDISATATDHFSPIDPQDKVRKLIGRSINNAFAGLLEETQQKIAAKK